MREEGDERMADASGDMNDIDVTSQSADHLHPTTMSEQLMGSPTPTISPKPTPTRPYDPSVPPELSQLPTTPLLWCNPMTVTLEQIKENT